MDGMIILDTGKGSLTSGDLSTHIATLPHKVGSAYQAPDLAYLALYWGESPCEYLKPRLSADLTLWQH